EGEEENEDDAGEKAEFLAEHGEDEIGMGVGKNALGRSPAGAGAEETAVVERLKGRIDLEGVALVGAQEPVDARGDMREGLIGESQPRQRQRAETHDHRPWQT